MELAFQLIFILCTFCRSQTLNRANGIQHSCIFFIFFFAVEIMANAAVRHRLCAMHKPIRHKHSENGQQHLLKMVESMNLTCGARNIRTAHANGIPMKRLCGNDALTLFSLSSEYFEAELGRTVRGSTTMCASSSKITTTALHWPFIYLHRLWTCGLAFVSTNWPRASTDRYVYACVSYLLVILFWKNTMRVRAHARVFAFNIINNWHLSSKWSWSWSMDANGTCNEFFRKHFIDLPFRATFRT